MKKYLLDTNICVYYLKGMFAIDQKILKVGIENCYISVITLAELQYGVANSAEHKQTHNQQVLDNFAENLQVVPLETCLKVFAQIKTHLKKQGQIVDSFDLLIAATAIANEMVLVTHNTKHFERIEGIILEDWTI